MAEKSIMEYMTQDWIYCSDRLPDEYDRYLTFSWLTEDVPWILILNYGYPLYPETDRPCFYSSAEYGDAEHDDVIAWMPLPDPPERSKR